MKEFSHKVERLIELLSEGNDFQKRFALKLDDALYGISSTEMMYNCCLVLKDMACDPLIPIEIRQQSLRLHEKISISLRASGF